MLDNVTTPKSTTTQVLEDYMWNLIDSSVERSAVNPTVLAAVLYTYYDLDKYEVIETLADLAKGVRNGYNEEFAKRVLQTLEAYILKVNKD